MSTEENKAIVRRFIEEVFNEGNLNAIDAFVSPDMVDHTAPPGQPAGHESVRRALTLFRTAFPNWYTNIEDMIAEGDMVMFRETSSGTQRASLWASRPPGSGSP
jgi:predicted ester cyclase